MKTEYGIGEIGRVLKGEVERVKSLDELECPKDDVIIVPRIIGVYQSKETRNMMLDELSEVLHSLLMPIIDESASDNLDPYLVCVGYDPSIMSEETLKPALKRGFLDRVKVERYSDFPDFSKKQYEEIRKSMKTLCSIDSKDPRYKIAIERNKNILEQFRQDYGLTKLESFDLNSMNDLSDKVNGTGLISQIDKESLDLFNDLNNGSDDFGPSLN